MKKIIMALMILIPMGLAAQSKSFDDLLSKYENEEGYTCMNLGGDMLKNIPGMIDEAETEAKGVEAEELAEAKEAIENISSMKMIVTEKATPAFRKDVDKMIREGNYESLLAVNEGDNKVGIYISKDDVKKGEGEDKEIVIVVNSSDGENVVINIVGKGDPMKMIGNMNIKK